MLERPQRTELDEEPAQQAVYVEFGRDAFIATSRSPCSTTGASTRLLHNRFRGVEVGALGLTPRRWWVEPEDQRYR